MAEKQMTEAGALVIQNLGVLFQAGRIADELDDQLDDLMSEIIRELLPEEEWLLLLDEGWFALNAWRCEEDESDAFAYFSVWSSSLGDEHEDDEHLITQLCAQGDGQIGFSWEIDEKSFGKNKRWKNDLASKYKGLENHGFSYEVKKGAWCLYMRVDANALANAYANEAMEDVLRSEVERCIGLIKKAVPDFNAIIAAAREVM